MKCEGTRRGGKDRDKRLCVARGLFLCCNLQEVRCVLQEPSHKSLCGNGNGGNANRTCDTLRAFKNCDRGRVRVR